eukprot:GEMP01019137.1.p1 GENE.GEMP01019137.1~~GEMP01019137.1.p1  ORF type:complete len:276 (+),score=45.09 GEMP01019137.1:180-1007(+)
MWASIVFFCLLSQAVGVLKNQLRSSDCARQASEKCKNICESCKCFKHCNNCDLQATWATKLTSHNLELDEAHEESVKLCLMGVDEETFSDPLDKFFRGLNPLPEVSKIEIKKCEEEVAKFCIQSEMCALFCELKGEGNTEESTKCKSECEGDKGRCAAKAPGASDPYEESALPNTELNAQTTDQLMQCIAEKRDEVGEKTSGRREGHWQDVTTYGLDKLGVFQQIDYDKLIDNGIMVQSTEAEKNAVRSFRLSEEIEREKNNAAQEDEGYSSDSI